MSDPGGAPRPDAGSSPPEITGGQIAAALWGKLQQMRAVLQLLLVLAAACLVGAILPQGQTADFYSTRYGSALGNLITRVGFDRVFGTGWFLFLVALLALSMVACSRRLWVIAAGRRRLATPETVEARFAGAGETLAAHTDSDVDSVSGRLSGAARRRGYSVHAVGEADGAKWLQASKHRWATWGPVLTHYALFLIGIGALMGQLPGISVDSFIGVTEQQTYQDPEKTMPFSLRLDKFEIKVDPVLGGIENYYSELTIIDGGKEALHETISVNRPLKYRHFYLSQSSWGLAGAKVELTIDGEPYEALFPLRRETDPETGRFARWAFDRQAGAVLLPSGDVAIVARRFLADAQRLPDGHVEGRDGELVGTPAIDLSAVSQFEGGRHKIDDLGVLLPGETVEIPGGEVKFIGVVYWSGIGVRKDLGVPFVWTGFIGCVLGMMMVFYTRPRHVFVRLSETARGATSLQIACSDVPGDDPGSARGLWSSVLTEMGCEPAPEDASSAEEVEAE